jgi:hypothetical protein
MMRWRLTLVVGAAMGIIAGALAIAHGAADPKPAGQPEMKLPPGWTEDDMKACVAAGTPGKMQEVLVKGAGVWQGRTTMWMYPGAEPVKSECTSTVTAIMDGRYTRCEMAGDMPGMGPFSGFGINGYDNVARKFVSTWIDNQSTGIMNGTGELSADGRTLSWTFTFNCPIAKRPAVMRQVETITGPNTRTLEMFGTEPKSGKDFKMLSIEFTKK